jgi:hypothetical protein
MREETGMAEHLQDNPTTVAEHQRTFDGFIRFWVYVFGAAILVLIFLAIFNS